MPNRLADETSPYLLQHAHNPVDWYPWGPEALTRAKEESKPILLSIGYSACHWCHVMERESFENDAIASFLNEHFVSIKVDREERPDLDELYMRAVQAFQQGRGGWPMTVFLTPEGVPFFGGTYYPAAARQGMPSFLDVLTHMLSLWSGDPARVGEVTRQVRNLLASTSDLPDADDASQVASWLAPIAAAAASSYDPQHGGFGPAPKFPPHGLLAVLLAHGQHAAADRSTDMALHTLDRMAQGGMYDLLGGGFSRYSVDDAWRVPHFEKMLYDNAQLLPLYVDAWKITGAERFECVVRDTIGWALREMQLDEGAFAASQDADSEEGEGRFFAWTPDQIEAIFGPDDAQRLCLLLGVTERGTFEGGTSVLRLERPLNQLDLRERALIDRALVRMFRVRRIRQAPSRDDKVVTAWNGLMVSALARAGAAFDEPEWLAAASVAAQFLLDEVTIDGRLMRTYKDGRAHIPAYADDHAALALGLLDLYEATFDPRWLDQAEALADRLLELFWDDEGGLFYTGSDQPDLMIRSKHALGGSEPSANGLGALLFARLDTLLGRSDLGERADAILVRLAPYLERAPLGLGAESLAGAWRASHGQQIAIVGAPDAAADLWREVRTRYLPFAALAASASPADSRVPFLADKPTGDSPFAYVCRGAVCDLPVDEPSTLRAQLDYATRPVPLGLVADSQRAAPPPLPSDASKWVGGSPPPPGVAQLWCVFTASRVDARAAACELQRLAESLEGEPVAVVAVHSAKFPGEGTPEATQAAAVQAGLRVPVVLDPDRLVQRALGTEAWPTWVVIDSEGRIAARHEGWMPADAILPAVRAVLPDEGEPLALGPLPSPTEARLYGPQRLHVFPDAIMQEMGADALHGGLLYLSDTGRHQVLELELDADADGWPEARLLRRFGTGTPGFDDGSAADATFREPMGLSRSTRELFVADRGNHALRAIDLDTGAVRTLGGTGDRGVGRPRGRLRLDQPQQQPLRDPVDVEVLELKGATLAFVAMAGSHQIWAWGDEHLGLFAGSGLEDHIDGPAAEACLAQPMGLVLFGRYLLFVDGQTSSVRGVDLQHHQVVTIVGKGLDEHGDLDGTGEAVRLRHPNDLTFVGESLFVADRYNGKVRRIELASLRSSTVSGGDGSLGQPTGIDRIGPYLVLCDPQGDRVMVVHHETGEARQLAIHGL